MIMHNIFSDIIDSYYGTEKRILGLPLEPSFRRVRPTLRCGGRLTRYGALVVDSIDRTTDSLLFISRGAIISTWYWHRKNHKPRSLTHWYLKRYIFLSFPLSMFTPS